MAKIVFKELTSNHNVLFPVSLLEKIAPNHPFFTRFLIYLVLFGKVSP